MIKRIATTVTLTVGAFMASPVVQAFAGTTWS